MDPCLAHQVGDTLEGVVGIVLGLDSRQSSEVCAGSVRSRPSLSKCPPSVSYRHWRAGPVKKLARRNSSRRKLCTVNSQLNTRAQLISRSNFPPHTKNPTSTPGERLAKPSRKLAPRLVLAPESSRKRHRRCSSSSRATAFPRRTFFRIQTSGTLHPGKS